MTYDSSIPEASHLPSIDQPNMKTNFRVINEQITLEHDALTTGTPNGKHKWVTLRQRTAPIPAPAGTDIILQQSISGGKWTLETLDSTSRYRHVPLRTMLKPPITAAIPAGSGTRNVVDLATIGIGANSSGTIFLYDNLNFRRSVFSTFVFAVGNLYIPVGSAQLTVGSTFAKLDSAGSILQLEVNSYPVGGTTVTVIITESRTV